MGLPVTWVLNLDAEEELARGDRFARRRAVHDKIAELAPRLAGLIGPEDAVLGLAEPPGTRTPPVGRAWCPTPSAIAALDAAGVEPPRAPPVDVLRRVNHRRFSAELGSTLPGERFVSSEAELAASIAAESGGWWLLKRPFGFAGRNRRRIRAGELDDADRAWILASFARDGLQAEPWVERELDLGLHGYLHSNGERVIGSACVQRCDEHGVWISSELAGGALEAGEQRALEEEIERTATALVAAGYFGPFGIDAFRWRDGAGRQSFRARSEINARYSMGWAIGMNGFRPPAGSP